MPFRREGQARMGVGAVATQANVEISYGPLGLGRLAFCERREYTLACNWKVFVDNYLDGGYHVPHLHKGLGSQAMMIVRLGLHAGHAPTGQPCHRRIADP